MKLALLTAALLLSAAGVAAAATALTDPQTSVIQTCKLNGIGTLRVVAAAANCNAKLETPLSWNAQGPPGLPGATGAQGPPGSVSLATLAGSPCHDHAGSAGTIVLQTTSSDDVVLHCSVPTSGGGTPPDQPPVHLVSLTFQRYDATHYSATVTLNGPVTQDTSVTLTSSNTASIVVPGSVTVLAGQTTTAGLNGDVTVLGTAGADLTATLGSESIQTTLMPS